MMSNIPMALRHQDFQDMHSDMLEAARRESGAKNWRFVARIANIQSSGRSPDIFRSLAYHGVPVRVVD
jgi:hypothetical protein